MSYMSYNNITIELTKTNEFTQTPSRSRDGMDIVGNRYRIDVTGIINPHATSYDGPPGLPRLREGESPASTYNSIHAALTENRRTLLFRWGDTDIVVSPQQLSAGMDCEGGPNVISVALAPMGEFKTFLVRFIVETTINECAVVNPTIINPLASNRWESTHTIDSRFLTHIETRGVAVFHLDLLALFEVNADHFRSICLPNIPIGFRREHIDVSVDSKGRFLTYHILDSQQTYSLGSDNRNSPPRLRTPASLGIVSFSGTFFSAVPPIQRHDTGVAIAGPVNILGVAVQVIGNAFASRWNMIMFAARIAIQRLNINPGFIGKDGSLIRSVTVEESLESPVINYKMEVMKTPAAGNDAVGMATIFLQHIGKDELPLAFPGDANGGFPGGPTAQPPGDASTRGHYRGEILAQALQRACSVQQGDSGCVVNDGADFDNYKCLTNINVIDPDEKIDVLDRKPNKIKMTDIGVVTDVKIQISTKTDCHILVAPKSKLKKPGNSYPPPPPDPDPPFPRRKRGRPEVMTIAEPTSFMSVDWSMETIGAKPPYLGPDPPSGQAVLLREQIDAMGVELYTDGQTPIYRVSGRYDYVWLSSRDFGVDSIFMGISPFAEITNTEATLDPGIQDNDAIFDGSGGGSSGSPGGGGGAPVG